MNEKHIALLAMIGLLVVLNPGGCKHDKSVESEIVFLVSPTPSVAKLIDMLPQFEAETGIKVTVESVSYESMMAKETLDLRTRQGRYDVFWVESTYLERCALLNGLVDIGKLAREKDKDLSDFAPGLLDAFSYQGTLYALPFEGNPMVVAYRRDLLEAKDLQPAETWEEYERLIKALHAPPEVYGTSMMGARHEAVFYEYLNFLWGFGGRLFDEDRNPRLDSPEALKALSFMKSLLAYAPPGALSYTWTESATAFQQGNVAMTILFPDWTAALRDPNESRVVNKWIYAPIPGTRPTAIGGYGWAVNAYSSKTDAAFDFAYWATSQAVQRQLVSHGATLSRNSVLQDPELNEQYPYLKVLKRAATRARAPMKMESYFELSDSLALHLSEALTGATSPSAALEQAQRDWNKILNKNK